MMSCRGWGLAKWAGLVETGAPVSGAHGTSGWSPDAQRH